MAAITSEEDDVISEINVTPFVDVMLVLLVILMVTATFVSQQSLPVLLPAAASGQATPSDILNVTILADGNVMIDGKEYALPEISAAIASMGDPATFESIVRADKRVAHGTVVEVLDILRKSGLEKIGVGVLKAS